MAPYRTSSRDVDNNYINNDADNNLINGKEKKYKTEIVWRNVFAMVLMHIMGIYGFYLAAIGYGQWRSFIWAWFIGMLILLDNFLNSKVQISFIRLH